MAIHQFLQTQQCLWFMIYHSFRVNRHFHLITYQFYQLCLMVHMYQPYLAAIYHSTTFGHAVAAELLCCIVYNSCAQWHAHTWAVCKFARWFTFIFRFNILWACFCVSLDIQIQVLLVFVVMGLVPSVSSREIGCPEERLRNDLFSVELDAKP